MSDAPEHIALRWTEGAAITSGPLMDHPEYTRYVRADLIEQLFALLEVTEQTDDGRDFHPTTIRSSRALDAEKLNTIMAELKRSITANDTENDEWECYLRATEQPEMSQEDDTEAQPIPALKAAQERTKGMLTEADTEMNKHFVEMADRIEELEAKLAKVMNTLECYAGHWADDKTFVRTDDGGELASETINELTGCHHDIL